MPTFRAIGLAGAGLLLTGCGGEADRKTTAKADTTAPAAADAQLAALDGEVARLQTLAAADKQTVPEVLAAESPFVAARDKCGTGADAKACLVPLYAARAHALREASAGARADDAKSISIGPLPLSGKDASGAYSFWTKGDEAMFTRPGTVEAKCKFETAG